MRTTIRRRLPLLGYVFLAVMIAVTIGLVRNEGAQRRADLRAAASLVVEEGCTRDNDTRRVLRDLIRDGIPQVEQYVKEGLLTPEQGERSIASSRRAIRVLHDVDCDKVVKEFEREASASESRL